MPKQKRFRIISHLETCYCLEKWKLRLSIAKKEENMMILGEYRQLQQIINRRTRLLDHSLVKRSGWSRVLIVQDMILTFELSKSLEELEFDHVMQAIVLENKVFGDTHTMQIVVG